MIELLAAAAALATSSAPAAANLTCALGEMRASLSGRIVCLAEGAACRPRDQKAYRRYGFRCRNGMLAHDWGLLHRPLRLPRLSAEGPCPATARRLIAPRVVEALIAPVFGPGPAYPTLGEKSGRATAEMVWPPTEPPYVGWAGNKLLWAVPSYAGPVLVRGRQLDGTGALGFDLGPSWSNRVLSELRLSRGPAWGLRPAATFVPTPGCYGYQVDTPRNSYRIVFDVGFAF
jgi:hypothetical protein